ncbi:MAG: type II toxin-antitoxin system HicB family antitoxin [bacterium]|nr:type II toxin-antitoxin system HicB family antitoxin [bacterium]
MNNGYTAVVEKDDEWFIAFCSEIEGDNGEGRIIRDRLSNLNEAIALILLDREEDA